jgi:hypothetical protein
MSIGNATPAFWELEERRPAPRSFRKPLIPQRQIPEAVSNQFPAIEVLLSWRMSIHSDHSASSANLNTSSAERRRDTATTEMQQ